MKSDKILAGAALGLRLTRRSFRRKLIMFGVSIFSSLALTATGFAAWVLSQDAKQEANGSIDVATVTDKTIEMSAIEFVDGVRNYVFDAQKNDEDGRVKWDGTNSESLAVQASWTVTNYDFVTTHTAEFLIPEGIQKSINAGYIVAPTGLIQKTTGSGDSVTPVTEELDLDGDSTKSVYYVYYYNVALNTKLTGTNGVDGPVTWTKDPANGRKITFTLNLTFAWGDEFGGVNPSEYYDSEAGKDVAIKTVEQTLRQLKLNAHGVTTNLTDWDPNNSKTDDEFNALWQGKAIPNYLLRVTATVD